MKGEITHTINVDQELTLLYSKWPDIKRYLKSIGCGTSNAEDIFQEALVIFIGKVEDTDFELTVAPFHYVKNTCKFLWYNQSRKEQTREKGEFFDAMSEGEDEWIQKELKLQSIESALSQIGKKCQQLLQMFYGLGMSMVDIAKKINLRNDKVAKAQKYRCINKVKEIVLSKTENQTPLNEEL
jgi:RNA polymerase sigma factor (sigma-70 family)